MIKLRKILLLDKIYIFLFLLITIFSITYTKLKNNISKYNINDKKFNIRINNYKVDGDKLTIEGKGKEKLIGTYYFQSLKEKETFIEKLNIGDIITITGELTTPKSNTILNQFNYKKYLYNNKIYYLLSIDTYKLKKSNKNILYKIKNYFYKRINKIDKNGYYYTFLLGEKSYINNDVNNSYSINGISHLFALSGLHVSIFSLILVKILKAFKLNEINRIIFIFIFLLVFCFITGFSPSICRATIFFFLLSINKYYTFFIKSENVLILTYTIILIINPYTIYMLGFILSFTITYFILISSELINTNKKIKSLLYTSIISFFSSLPIIIYNFYEVNFLGIFLNIFFVPYVSTIVYPLTLISFIIPNNILNITIKILEYLSLKCSKITFLKIIFPKINLISILFYYIFLIIFIKTKNKKIIYIILTLIIIWYIKPNLNSDFRIYYTDVSQGDSIIIIDKYLRKTLLIDTGGKVLNTNNSEEWQKKNNIYKLSDTLITFYKSLGIKKIDYLILTHGDADHMGEAINLVENFKVENVIFNCGSYNDLEKELIKVLDKKKINYYSCIKELNIDKYKLQFLNTKKYNNENDNSNVIYFNYNDYKFLFMGDAGIEKEKDILDKYNLKDIDFLKVGHHGSNTSSSNYFIDEINPKYSLISVGKNNRYGHPKQEVLEILKNSKIYRTDLDGSIEIKLNKNGYKIRTCPP